MRNGGLMADQVEITLSDTYCLTADDLLNHHLLILGATGSGKSTSAVSIMHDLIMQNQAVVILDPTGEYTHLPHAVVARLGMNAFLDYERLSAQEWAMILEITNPRQIEKLSDAIDSLRIQRHIRHQNGIYQKLNKAWSEYEVERQQLYHYPQSFDVTLLAEQLREEYVQPYFDERADFSLLGQQYDYDAFKVWQQDLQRLKTFVFNPLYQKLLNLPTDDDTERYVGMRTEILYLLTLFSTHKSQQKALVIDLSVLAVDLRLGQHVVSLLAANLLGLRMEQKNRLPVTLVLDEAHRYLTADDQVDTNGISRIAREGRKFGLYLMVTTQSPTDLQGQFLGQFGMLLVHRLNTKEEIEQLPGLVPFSSVIIQQHPGVAHLYGQNIAQAQAVHVQMKSDMQHQTNSPRYF